MALRELELLNFRNYPSLQLELPTEGALFYGENGAGKTNLLEAMSVVTLGKSVRPVSLRDLITKGKYESFVGASFSDGESLEQQSVGFSKNKQLTISQGGFQQNSLSSLYKKNRFIYFGPTDIALVTGSREEKRRALDQIISQKSPHYLQALISYRTLVRQRNALLTALSLDKALLEVYHQQIAEVAWIIYNERKNFFATIAPSFTSFYQSISGAEAAITISYQPSLLVTSQEEYTEKLSQNCEKDRELGYTSLGVHRDSFTFKVNGHKFVGYGSQGQMRLVALCFKRCSLIYLEEEYNERVIVAIDDAFSDLDKGRRTLFFEHILGKAQLFIAVHSKEDIATYSLPLFTIEKGIVDASKN